MLVAIGGSNSDEETAGAAVGDVVAIGSDASGAVGDAAEVAVTDAVVDEHQRYPAITGSLRVTRGGEGGEEGGGGDVGGGLSI
uniref:Uncharacterized protein n=1 Tax=Vespula pensylvanica TaxID=30213 RepID=A0A834UC27_VESPE|nr:hypothetical protein H0235_006314 [Vespula pensylvanica]